MKFRINIIPQVGSIYYVEPKDKIKFRDAYRGKIKITQRVDKSYYATILTNYSYWEEGDKNVGFNSAIFKFIPRKS